MSIPFTDDQPQLENQERLIWRGGYSIKSMVSAWIGAALISALIVLAVLYIQPFRESQTTWLTMTALFALIWFGLALTAAYRILNRHYEITTQRLLHRTGILLRQIDRIEMIDIDDVSYRQGPIQTLMNVGTIQLQSSDTSHPILVLPGIANVKQIANRIDDSRRRERHIRGIHVESI